MDLREAALQFAQHHASAKRLAPLTVKAYRSDVREFVAWRAAQGLACEVDQVEASEVEGFCAAYDDLSPATLRRRLDSISSLYRFLLKRRLAATNPVDQVDRPRCPDSHRGYLTVAQMERLLAVTEGSAETAISGLLCFLALRRSEVASLNCGDVALATGHIEIRQSKGGHSRTLPIPPELRLALQTYLCGLQAPPNAPLFTSHRGNRMSRSVLARLFGKWLDRAGLEGQGLSPHSCQHGCASRWLRSGLTLVEVQQILGHRSVDVTGRCCHATVDEIAASIGAKVVPLG